MMYDSVVMLSVFTCKKRYIYYEGFSFYPNPPFISEVNGEEGQVLRAGIAKNKNSDPCEKFLYGWLGDSATN